jgi:putative ABC transport system substrate-binding protein
MKFTRYAIYLIIPLILVQLACNAPAIRPSDDPAPQPTVVAQTETDQQAEAEQISEAPDIEWFQPPEEMLTTWKIVPGPDDSFMVSLVPTYLDDSTTETKKLLFLYTKAHPLFDHSTNQVLSVFVDRDIPVEATIILAEDEQAGKDAIAYAEANQFDLIFSMGSDASAFLHETYQGGEIPVVTLLAKDPVLLGQMPDYESGSGTNIAYTSVGVPADLQMRYFQELVPNLKNIVILYAQENASAVKTQVEPLDDYAQAAGMNLIHVAVLNQEEPDETRAELENKLSQAVSQIEEIDPEAEESIILVTSSSSIVNVFETVDALANNIPVVSLFPDLVRAGEVSAVLSVGVSFDSNSLLAALYGVRILQGEASPGELPVGVITPPDIAISFAKTREIDLKIPFAFFESATFIYDPNGELVREQGQPVEQP